MKSVGAIAMFGLLWSTKSLPELRLGLSDCYLSLVLRRIMGTRNDSGTWLPRFILRQLLTWGAAGFTCGLIGS